QHCSLNGQFLQKLSLLRYVRLMYPLLSVFSPLNSKMALFDPSFIHSYWCNSLLKYEEEFYSDFEILDEDAEVNPFEHDKQIFTYNLLEYVETELQKSNSEDEEIENLISETIALKNNLQNLTKKVVIRKMSIIFSKVKKKGLKLFLDIIDVAKKEIIKKALYGGIGEIEHLTNTLW
ncbi:hypothetical protein, partial [Flavobacterium psychrophilum]|uniref:hypothetical protein n=7 Tax=Flavobacterium psychrophilum TaxID=96345 RepID=UPI0039EB5843